MSPHGIESVLPSWKVGEATASPPSRAIDINNLLIKADLKTQPEINLCVFL